VLPEVVLNLGERETIFVLVHSTNDGLWRKPHALEPVGFDELTMTGITQVALLYPHFPVS